MTAAQAAAYVQGQVMMAQLQMQAMIAENAEREDQGKALAHGPEEFLAVQARFCISHNAVIQFYNQCVGE